LKHVVLNNVVLSLTFLLLLLFLVGLIYTSAEYIEALKVLKKYRELLLLPVAVCLLHDNPRARIHCENSYLAGSLLIMIISYAMFFSIIPTAKYGYSFLYHITHSFFMSYLAFVAAHRSIDAVSTRHRMFWGCVLLLSVVNMFYVGTGRTGMLVFVVLIVLFFMQRLSFLKQLVSILLLVLLLAVAFKTSDTFNEKFTAAVDEVQQFEQGHSRTSLGMRLDWWIDSSLMMKQKPVMGYGTGSFEKEHTAYISGTDIMVTDNPHNEFLLIGVQLGGVGLLVFVLILIFQLICSFRGGPPQSYYLQGVVVAMIVGCSTNSFLFDTHEGHFWALLSAVYLSAHPNCMRLSFSKGSR